MWRRKLTKHTRPISAETLHRLYLDEGSSIIRVARELGLPKTNVEYWLEKHGIARRPLLIYERHPFSGDAREKSYLLGLRLGDLHVVRYGFGIKVSTTTTHPAMLSLFRKTFEGYGHVSSSPSYNKRTDEYQWSTRVNLDFSFMFLLEKRQSVPDWVARSRLLFLHFLAGFVDAEGSIGVAFRTRHRHRYIEPQMSVSNTNLALLRSIAGLASPYFPSLYLEHEAGRATSRKGAIRRKDQWSISFFRREVLRDLLIRLPLRHAEKLERSRMVIDFLNGCDWTTARRRFRQFRLKIKRDVSELAKLAKRQLSK